ncbi:hypothetical protein MACJ_003820 [Theileria orientalis]|uniref:Uncharacterized protein n=1 Tax=Theileria orientalis TaxID=68886 RepID=A0A976SKM4_THEOR|nr:hypothetical protein MACJ_003820 [Theileria orientalis]
MLPCEGYNYGTELDAKFMLNQKVVEVQ